MKHIFAFLIAIMVSPVFADTIANVEYNLPSARKAWVKVKSIEEEANPDATTRTFIYGPSKEALDNPIEFFAVHTNNLPTVGMTSKELESNLEDALEGKALVHILENSADSALYEWVVDEEGLYIFSLGRAFFSAEGTIVLLYQTNDHNKAHTEKELWMKTLKTAKKI